MGERERARKRAEDAKGEEACASVKDVRRRKRAVSEYKGKRKRKKKSKGTFP